MTWMTIRDMAGKSHFVNLTAITQVAQEKGQFRVHLVGAGQEFTIDETEWQKLSTVLQQPGEPGAHA